MTNLDSRWKSRDITSPTKVHLIRAMVFPVVMYGCESWTIKKAEHWRIDVFELWCWRRLLRVPWTGRRSNHSILKEINPEYSLARLMLKLKLHYFGHLMGRTDSFEKTLMLGKIEGKGRRGWQRTRRLDGITDSHGCEFEQALGDGEGQRSLACCSPRGHRVGHDWATEQQHCEISPQNSSVHCRGTLGLDLVPWFRPALPLQDLNCFLVPPWQSPACHLDHSNLTVFFKHLLPILKSVLKRTISDGKPVSSAMIQGMVSRMKTKQCY